MIKGKFNCISLIVNLKNKRGFLKNIYITNRQNIYTVYNNFENEKTSQTHNEKYQKYLNQCAINRPHTHVILLLNDHDLQSR